MWEAWKALDKLEKAGDTLRNIQVWPRRPVPSPQKMVDDLRLTALDDSENTVDTELKKSEEPDRWKYEKNDQHFKYCV
ncbi:hypothetical protein Ocin01_16779 [Orchesella cincta]|uniref:Uncharacterized protein n=1 Tax=Orchesella cincta TaxID=48709 RepID=A0A1D2MA98_ORCCI|nr:hypothetical protein Ocin01_16779 [Orchesella cincta]